MTPPLPMPPSKTETPKEVIPVKVVTPGTETLPVPPVPEVQSPNP